MTYANQVRLLKLNIQSLAAVIGQGLIAAVLPGIQALNALMTKLMQAATVFRDFMYVLMGKKIKGSQSGVVNDLAGLEDTSYDLSGIEDAGDSAADGLDNATSAAKDLKKALSVLPFDELNQLTDNSDSGSSGTGSGSGGTGSGGSGVSGLSSGLGNLLDDAYDVDEISPVNEWAAKIRKAFLAHDWEGLGKTVADGINKGLQKVYNLFKWDNAKKKIEPFIDAFTRTVNSLVDNLDWDLMGRTVGAGITTLAKSFKLLTEGIDFVGIGASLSKALKGLLSESDWKDIGSAIGDGFMIAWNIFGGFVSDMSKTDKVTGLTGFQQLGSAVASTLNGVFSKISFKGIATALTKGINGAFESLAEFTKDFKWKDFQKNLKDGITTVIKDIKWKENAQALSDFLSHLCSAISDLVDSGTFHDLGVKIGNFIASLPWGELLKTAADALWSGFTGLLEGLFKSEGFAGKIAAALAAGFAIVKVADITGLDTLASGVIKLISGKLSRKAEAQSIASALETVLGDGATAANATGKLGGITTAAGDLASAISPLVGEAGLIVGLGAAAVYATEQVAKWTEKMQGGNGIGGTFGNTTNNLIKRLKDQGDISSSTAKEITTYRESLEKADMSSDDMKEATKDLVTKLGELGVTKEQATEALKAIEQQGGITDDMLGILTESIDGLGTAASTMGTNVELGNGLAKDSYDDLYYSISQVATQSDLGEQSIGSLQNALDITVQKKGTTQEAFEAIMKAVQDLGGNVDVASKIFSETFPGAMVTASTSADTEVKKISNSISSELSSTSEVAKEKMSITQGAISNNMLAASRDSSAYASQVYDKITKATGDTASEVEGDMSSVEKSVTGHTNNAAFSANTNSNSIAKNIESGYKSAAGSVSQYTSDIDSKTSTVFGNTYTSAYTNTSEVKKAINDGYGEIYKAVKGWMDSIYDVQFGKAGKWTLAKSDVGIKIDSMTKTINEKFPSVVKTVGDYASQIQKKLSNGASEALKSYKELPSKIKSAMSNMYSIGQSAGQSFAKGIKSAYIQRPYLYVSSWNKNYYNDGKSWYSTPNFSVGWYAKGGLFDAASIIGVGEAGKEAVLPLENKRTMKMIADSIADSSGGGIGLSHDELSEAVAEGVAMAMMNNSGNNGTPEYAMVNISVGENEFARAITKVQNKYNSRMSPSPVY